MIRNQRERFRISETEGRDLQAALADNRFSPPIDHAYTHVYPSHVAGNKMAIGHSDHLFVHLFPAATTRSCLGFVTASNSARAARYFNVRGKQRVRVIREKMASRAMVMRAILC
jgi:hypothetical protein